jgi:hypothetical protein
VGQLELIVSVWGDIKMKDEFCPACVVDFLKKNHIDELGDEIFTLNHPGMEDEWEFKNCIMHPKGKTTSKSLEEARVLTKPRYDEIMASLFLIKRE